MNEQSHFKPFDTAVAESRLHPLTARGISTFQVNVGRLCNQNCAHCHVDAGFDRKEIMQKETMEACIKAVEKTDIPIIDITGGAPEMNPNFKWFVKEFKNRGRHVIVRSNLTILRESNYLDLPEFFAENKIEVIASLPCYLEQNVDRQRGAGVFKKSIEALQHLNAIGYAKEGAGLILNLMYNPGGSFLPPSQKSLEADYKKELLEKYGIVFNNLYTLTNMPIGRFLNELNASKNYSAYMEKLVHSYNPNAASLVMCRYTLSVGWDGSLYDCDFNQMLGMKVNPVRSFSQKETDAPSEEIAVSTGTSNRVNHGMPSNIKEFDINNLAGRQIVTGFHCYGCTAGAGSSCTGAAA